MFAEGRWTLSLVSGGMFKKLRKRGYVMFPKRSMLLILVVAVFLSSVSTLFAQVNSSAALRGTVMDKTKAVIPNAEVRIGNRETGLERATVSGEQGLYQFDLLPAGRYEVRVAVKGFSTAVFQNVELAVSQTTTLDATLSPSTQAETVTVEATASLIDVQKTDVSRAVTPSEVQNLPLNGRDFVNLALLAPGARPVNSFDPTKNRIGVFATNGSSGRNVNITVNGVDDKDGTVGGLVMQWPLRRRIGERDHQIRIQQLPRRTLLLRSRPGLQHAQLF